MILIYFVLDLAPRFCILRPLAEEKLNWHKQNGDKIVIVLASLEKYLAPWREKNGFELIASRL